MPSRKATSAPPSFTDVVSAAPPALHAVAAELRQFIQQQLPGASEGIHGGAKVKLALYSVGGRVICGLQPSAACCLLYVHAVTERDAPALPLAGAGKRNRHVKLHSVAELRGLAPALGELLRLAVRRQSADASPESEGSRPAS